MKKIIFVVVLVFTISSPGCMTVNLNASGYEKTVSLTSTDKKFTILKHFTREMKSWYTLFNLIPLTEPNVAELLRDETASSHGDAIINVKIQGQTTLMDAAIPIAAGIFGSIISGKNGNGNGVFIGLLIGARTYTIEGDVIKYIE